MPSLREHEAVAEWFVHELVAREVERHPHTPALLGEEGRTVSYGELSWRAGNLAAQLIAAGVRPDHRVAVFMERSAALVIAMCAVLQSGGAYVPIDPANPEARIAAILDSVGASAVIADPALVPRLPHLHVPLLGVAAMDVVHGDSAAIEPALQPDHLAYVLYTSGSTGAPKGVAMSHRGLSRLCAWQIDSGPSAMRTLQFTPMGFDVTFQEVFSTLATGGTLVVVPDALRRDPERLLLLLDEQAVERMFLPYVALQQIAKASARMGIVPRVLRHVITAGERLIVTEAIADFFHRMPECRLDNHYGPTEAHLVTSFTLTGDARDWPALPPIGRAVAGVTLAVLDEHLAPVPDGQTGELYVGGEGVARGYHGAPALTAERFLPDLSGAGRMYRTGDLVRVDGDGVVHFGGRADDQLKVRGYRVEPAEVEWSLTSHAQVRQAAVGLRTLADGVDALVAYVVADVAVSAADLTRHARASLPPYMVPSRFVFLDALPLTTSGKVDHLRLREIALPEAVTEPMAGRMLAQTVRSIWERVLGHDEIEPDEDFFEVGGDSLLAAWVVTELSQAVGREIELSLMLRESTIDGLARALESLAVQPDGAARQSEIITLRPGPSKRVLYLVHPLGGELLAYRAFANAMRSPLRVLGIRWRPDPGNGHEQTLEEIAAVHYAQLRIVQPHGPYLLAGWSFGGVMAYELAQQLLAAGETVEFLGLLDANPLRDPLTGLFTRESPHYDTLTGLVRAFDDGDEKSIPRLLADPALRRLLGDVPEGVTAAHLRRNLDVARTSMRAAMHYRPAPYRAAIDLFQADDAPAGMQALLADEIRALAAGPLRIHSVPGNHSAMLHTPSVETTARTIDRALSNNARRP